jgi:4-amino-4-deoxy-L-arabinose transferase-like glycosyltransferase
MFDSKVGVYAALLMSIEPISWISSQKIWMETTLAFFTVLSLYLFVLARKKYNPWIMMGSGVAAGLATLTKYPGVLATGIIFLYTLCCERWLFKKKTFIFSLSVPFIMLVPWFLWNFRIYGPELFSTNVEITYLLKRTVFFMKKSWPFLFLAIAIPACLAFIKKKSADLYEQKIVPKINILLWVLISSLLFALVFILRDNFINALNLRHVPEAGWKIGMFADEPWYFYLGKMVELSPFYMFSYLALFLFFFDKERMREYFFLFLGSFMILAFYILWKNYQCRYITALTVPFMVLAARVQVFIFNKTSEIGSIKTRLIAQVLCFLAVFYMAAKTLLIDVIYALPNNVCYF